MVTEEIQLEGHIIDSLILSKVLDEIQSFGGEFNIREVKVGQKQGDRSKASVEVSAGSQEQLTQILSQLAKHGATVRRPEDVRLVAAEQDAVFPVGFYSTTNLKTLVRHQGQWFEARHQE